MNFDVKVIPFSRYGSYMVFSHLPAKAGLRREGLYLRSVRGPDLSPDPYQSVFRVEPVREKQVEFTETASPTLLRLEAEGGRIEICLPEPRLARIRCVGTGARLTMTISDYDNAFPRKGNRWQMTKSGAFETKYMLTPLQGNLTVDAPWKTVSSERVVMDLSPDPNTGEGEIAIEEFDAAWQEREYPGSFDDCQSSLQQEYRAWQTRLPEVPEAYAETAAMAAYINWSCVVAPDGHITRPAMYMSKFRMASIWSWDHCFNAMALAYKYPELAWDQLMIMVDKQDASGAFPDLVNDRLVSRSFCKPPVHGWALGRMMKQTDLGKERLQEIYEPLIRWTQWWFKYCDDDGDGIPQYNHGNDSGWDNSTIFASRPPIEAPDLSAYLVIQMETLADVARILGKDGEAKDWKSRADELLRKMLAHFWRGDRFVAVCSGSHEVIESNSLQLFIPIILGKRLPEDVRSNLIAGLKAPDRFLTDYGLATEESSSPLYERDGYWRGPIWGAPMMLIADGLAAAGETEFARTLTRRFCDMVAQNGIAENYDAASGVGLRERAFTWTASIFLILAHELGGGK